MAILHLIYLTQYIWFSFHAEQVIKGPIVQLYIKQASTCIVNLAILKSDFNYNINIHDIDWVDINNGL